MKKLLIPFLFFYSILTAQDKYADFNFEAPLPLDTIAIRGSFENGLKYYIKENDRPKKTVEFRLFVKVGSMQEDNDQLGVAHVLEHLLFNGTKNFPKKAIIEYLESIGVKFGADLNAYTGFNETVYMLSVPSDDMSKVDTAFKILADWAHNATLDEDEIEAERGVVLEEHRLHYKSVNGRIMEAFKKVAYPETREVKRFPIGTEESIKNFKTERLRDFYKTWYRPNLMAVAVTGDIDKSYAKQKIKEHFSKLTNPENPRPLKVFGAAPFVAEKKIKVFSDPELTNNVVYITFLDKERKPEAPATIKNEFINELNSILIQIFNNRLQELAFQKNAPFLGAQIYRGGSIVKNQLSSGGYIGFAEGKAETAIQAFYLELEKALRFGFTETELENAKKNVRSNAEKRFTTRNERYSKQIVGDLLSEYRKNWALNSLDWEYEFDKQIIDLISLDEINETFKKYFTRENQKILVLQPKKEGIEDPSETKIRSIIEDLENNTAITAYKEKKLDTKLVKDLKPKGQIISEIDEGFGIKKLTLSNGASVYYKKTDFDTDYIGFNAYSYGGTSLLSDEEAKTIGNAQGLIKSAGLGGYKMYELPKVLAGKDVRVRSFVNTYDENLNGKSKSSDMETLFQLIYLNFTAVNQDEDTYKLVLGKVNENVKNQLLNPRTAFNNKVEKIINKNNSRYLNIYENEGFKKTVMTTPYSKAYNFYTKRFENAGDFNFFFVGDFEELKFKEYIETYIASLPAKEERENYKLHPFESNLMGQEIVVKKGLDEKAVLDIKYSHEIAYDAKENKALAVFKTILQRRLREKIREENSGTYSVRVNLWHKGRPLKEYVANINFECAPENIEKLQKETLETVEEFVANGPTKEEVQSVKEQWIVSRKKQARENGHWLSKMKTTVYWKKSIAKMYDQDKLDSKISTKYVKKVAKKIIGKPKLIAKLLPEEKSQ